MAEVNEEARYVPHHPQKIVLIFSAMRHFAQALRERGWRVIYTRLDDADNSGSIAGEVLRWHATLGEPAVHFTECGEWRLEQALRQCGIPLAWHEDRRFLCSRAEFVHWAGNRQTLRMEHFYREMRRRTGLLMEPSGQPVGGHWNLDADNRKPLPRGTAGPFAARFGQDSITREVMTLVAEYFSNHYGRLDSFDYPVTHEQARELWRHFLEFALPAFGDYQDAMAEGEPYLFHARISAALNIGLLDVRQLAADVEEAYRQGQAPLNAAEGFIRQLIGWREYVRGIYRLRMPDYAELNGFGNRRPLPAFYWTGQTDMRCMAQAIGQTLEAGLRAPHPAADGHRQFRPAGWHRAGGHLRLVPGGLPGRLRLGRVAQHAGHGDARRRGLPRVETLLRKRPLHPADVRSLWRLPLPSGQSHGRRRLPVQRALLAFPHAAPRPSRAQPSPGHALP